MSIYKKVCGCLWLFRLVNKIIHLANARTRRCRFLPDNVCLCIIFLSIVWTCISLYIQIVWFAPRIRLYIVLSIESERWHFIRLIWAYFSVFCKLEDFLAIFSTAVYNFIWGGICSFALSKIFFRLQSCRWIKDTVIIISFLRALLRLYELSVNLEKLGGQIRPQILVTSRHAEITFIME